MLWLTVPFITFKQELFLVVILNLYESMFQSAVKILLFAPCTPFHSKYRLHTAVTVAHISKFFIRRSTALVGEIPGPNVLMHWGISVASFLESDKALTTATAPPPITSLKDS